MFFTSYQFLFLFVPVAWAGCLLLHQGRLERTAAWWLVALSLVFYASLDAQHLPQLLVSIGVNYAAVALIHRYRRSNERAAWLCMQAGVAFNIGFLVWLKYADLLWGGTGEGATASIPLGISFFTVQQIACLVSTCNDDDAACPPMHRYALFVTFFPYVIAGPIVTRQEVMGQLGDLSAQRMKKLLLPALTLFSLGLFKKVVFADNLGLQVDPVFQAAAQGQPLSAADAWAGAALYTLQIYFDFSGYSDMAAGLAGLFGLHLPRNFHSPLKACSLMEFWRRWHMSATRFFTNFLYLPLVLKLMRLAVRWRLGGLMRYVVTVLLPMLVTFFLIGIWHGAGITAMVFGLLMGAAISVNHLWIKLQLPGLPRWAGWLLTMGVVVVGMVFSRADDMAMADAVLHAMAGLGTGGGGAALLDPSIVLAWLLLLGAVVLLAPNTSEIMERFPVVLKETWDALPAWQERFKWHQGTRGAVLASLIFCVSAALIPKAAQFIYYRF